MRVVSEYKHKSNVLASWGGGGVGRGESNLRN